MPGQRSGSGSRGRSAERGAVGGRVRPALAGEPLVGLRAAVVIQIEQGVLVVLAPLKVAVGDHHFVAVADALGQHFTGRGDDLRLGE